MPSFPDSWDILVVFFSVLVFFYVCLVSFLVTHRNCSTSCLRMGCVSEMTELPTDLMLVSNMGRGKGGSLISASLKEISEQTVFSVMYRSF